MVSFINCTKRWDFVELSPNPRLRPVLKSGFDDVLYEGTKI
jgi:hypothetical protein